MNVQTQEQAGRFFFDCGKLSFAGLVLTSMDHRPFTWSEVSAGVYLTLLFFVVGVMILQFVKDKNI